MPHMHKHKARVTLKPIQKFVLSFVLFITLPFVLSGCSQIPVHTTSSNNWNRIIAVTTSHDAQAKYYENILLGRIALGQKNFKDALTYYKYAIEYKPELTLVKEAMVMSETIADTKTSIKMANLWISEDVDAIIAWRLLTFYAVQNNQLDQAKINIGNVIRLETDKAELFKFLGQLTFGSNLEPASRLFELIQDDYPEIPEVPLVIAHISIKKKHWDKALNITSKLIKTHPDLKYAWVIQGIALESSLKNNKAIDLYRLADQHFTDTTEFKRSLGHLYYQLDKFVEARAEFISILKVEPANSDAQYMVAASFFSEGELTKSQEFFEPLLRIKHHRNAVLYYLGEISRKQKNWDSAIAFYRQVKPSRYFETSHIQVSQLLKQQGHNLQALNYLKHLAIEDENSNIRYVRAMDAEVLGQSDYAIREFRSILKFEPNHYDAMNALGYTMADHNLNLDEALKLIRRAYDKAPNNASIIDSLGWVHFKLGNPSLAHGYLQRAYELSQSADIASHLAIVLVRLQQRDEAERVVALAYKNNPENPTLLKTIKNYNFEVSQKGSGT